MIEERARCRLWAVPASVSLGMRMPKAEGGRQRERGRVGVELGLMGSEQRRCLPCS